MPQQEPRILAAFSKDENMINAYKHGKDLYATIAAGVYHNKYEDNLEYPESLENSIEHEEIINVENDFLKLYFTDEIINNAGQLVEAKNLKVGDYIQTSEGNKQIKKLNLENIYVLIELN